MSRMIDADKLSAQLELVAREAESKGNREQAFVCRCIKQLIDETETVEREEDET